ncbi:HNH endonuclease [Kineosporia babensis]|uniref:HNH endonuclease n=1 Tax=Kineosporia babensis TaxID=499548 RepID=UPI0038B40187
MIPMVRLPLPDPVQARLHELTGALTGEAADARRAWKNAKAERSSVRSMLQSMAAGRHRCMFCGDSEGSAIDHYQPIAHLPARTFDWSNHLLACTHCNSNFKRDRFPFSMGTRSCSTRPATTPGSTCA